jgi:hypothetical protein
VGVPVCLCNNNLALQFPTSDSFFLFFFFPCPYCLLRFMRFSIFMQLGPKVEDVKEPVNPFVFLYRFILGAMAATYYVLIPIYMWLKDQIVPKGQPI